MQISYKKIGFFVAISAQAAFLLVSCAPYQAHKGATYFRQNGKASWYGPGFVGRKTASGERFDPNALTAAHKELPFNTTVKVTNTANDKSVIVRINDRGPYSGRRIIDLSKAAAKKIGLIGTGTAMVEIETITPKGKEPSPAQDSLSSEEHDVGKEPIKLAARGPVRRNGVEYLISQEKVKGDSPSSEIAATKELTEEPEISPQPTESKSKKMGTFEDSFIISSKQPTSERTSKTKPAPESYSADEDDF